MSTVGLYDDARFPGRLLVSLDQHHEHLDEVPEELAVAFMHDVRTASHVVRKLTGADRVNVAILGNQEPHVHAHLIPRSPVREPLPERSPWDDPRPRAQLDPSLRYALVQQFSEALN